VEWIGLLERRRDGAVTIATDAAFSTARDTNAGGVRGRHGGDEPHRGDHCKSACHTRKYAGSAAGMAWKAAVPNPRHPGFDPGSRFSRTRRGGRMSIVARIHRHRLGAGPEGVTPDERAVTGRLVRAGSGTPDQIRGDVGALIVFGS